MAEGYSDIAHSTYSEWKANTIGRAFDLDGSYGCQCWDYASLFWRNVGFPAGYPQTGDGNAYGCWTLRRDVNAGTEFDLIYDKTQIQEGDIIVMNGTSSNPPGHITFADENYNGTDSIRCLGQNQGGSPQPGGGTAVTLNTLGLGDFLGAFRYKNWHSTPPTPTFSTHRFKWVLYAKHLRNRSNM